MLTVSSSLRLAAGAVSRTKSFKTNTNQKYILLIALLLSIRPQAPFAHWISFKNIAHHNKSIEMIQNVQTYKSPSRFMCCVSILYIYIYICICIYVHIHMYICMCIHIYMYIYMCIHILSLFLLFLLMPIYVIYIYLYIYTWWVVFEFMLT